MKNRGGTPAIFNLITGIALVGALCIGGFAVLVFFNPGLLPDQFAPLPPVPTVPDLPPSPTASRTPGQQLPPTWTHTPTNPATDTPTNTPIPLDTSTPEATTPTDTIGTVQPGDNNFAFVVQEGNPIAIPNITHEDLGCNWTGVAGQAFDISGAPIVGITVHLGGSLLDIPLDLLSLTGTATKYGQGGYEFTLLNGTAASTGKIFVQLLDQNGLPLSDKVFFDTFAECDKSLVLINFKQVQ